ncbi:hypothetical protein J6590_102194 [Homalodisca vitripennis]|nr:hypothetical protein J6590_102194 [Homalodisca vitripennis]
MASVPTLIFYTVGKFLKSHLRLKLYLVYPKVSTEKVTCAEIYIHASAPGPSSTSMNWFSCYLCSTHCPKNNLYTRNDRCSTLNFYSVGKSLKSHLSRGISALMDSAAIAALLFDTFLIQSG